MFFFPFAWLFTYFFLSGYHPPLIDNNLLISFWTVPLSKSATALNIKKKKKNIKLWVFLHMHVKEACNSCVWSKF